MRDSPTEELAGCEDIYWIWFQLVFGVGSRRSEIMSDYFSGPKEIFEGVKARDRAAGMLTAEELAACDPCFERAGNIERATRKKGVDIITPQHPDYPGLLSQIYAKPAVLYVKGDLGCLRGKLAIAMVGSRKHTEYGRDVSAHLATGLAQGGAVVVSGLAHGIDTECHMAAIAAGGKSIGVLGCGIDVDYPAGNAHTKRQLCDNGAVVTEFPLGTEPRSGYFPIRNRIVSGMCHGVVVVEADIASGSLLTAHHAVEQGRDVFAVPGSIFSKRSLGAHRLIREGAKLTASAQDIFEEYAYLGFGKARGANKAARAGAISYSKKPPMKIDDAANTVERQRASPKAAPDIEGTALAVYKALGETPITAEEIAARLKAESVAEILSALTELEIYGLIQGYPGRRFGVPEVNIPETSS